MWFGYSLDVLDRIFCCYCVELILNHIELTEALIRIFCNLVEFILDHEVDHCHQLHTVAVEAAIDHKQITQVNKILRVFE